MRVRIIFGLNNRGASVPFHHQSLLTDMIQDLKYGAGGEASEYSLYSFSGLKGQTKVGKGGLHFFSSKVTLVFTCPDEKVTNAILKELFKRNEVNVGNLSLSPQSLERENEPEFKEQMKYICISPLVLNGPFTEGPIIKDFISPFDDLFSDYLYESTMSRMEVSGQFESEEVSSFYKFQVIPDKNYLSKIQESSKKFSRIYSTYQQAEKLEIRGYTLPLTLYADPTVQKFVFDCGFGEFANNGFGMLDLANVNPLGRTEVYEIDGVETHKE